MTYAALALAVLALVLERRGSSAVARAVEAEGARDAWAKAAAASAAEATKLEAIIVQRDREIARAWSAADACAAADPAAALRLLRDELDPTGTARARVPAG